LLSANGRPTATTACLVLGVTSLALAWRTSHKVRIAAICLTLLPALTVCGVFWMKFRTPFPDLTLNEQVPEAGHWREILDRNGNLTKAWRSYRLKWWPTCVPTPCGA